MDFELHPILENDVSPRPGLWYAVASEKSCPAARVGSAAVRTREVGCALLCAGASPEETFSDLHRLKIDSGSISWEKLPSTLLPPRYEHTLLLGPGGDDVFVFAGAQENGPLSDMWTCSADAPHEAELDTDGGEWRKIGVTGEVPDARTHHSSTCVWQDKMVVFSGGDCGTKTLDNSVYLFDMVSHTWVKPETEGPLPSPRQGHILAVVQDTLYVHGGMTSGGEILSSLYTLHLEQLKWSQPTLNGATPSPALAAHGCAVIGSQIYTFGGLTSSGACSILYCFDTASTIWNEVKIEGAAPPARLDHAMATITLDLRHSPSLPPSHYTSSQYSQNSHLTSSTSSSKPQLVTVLSPHVEDDAIKSAQIIEKSTDSGANDGISEQNEKEDGEQAASENDQLTAEKQIAVTENCVRGDGGKVGVTKYVSDEAEEKGESEVSACNENLLSRPNGGVEREVKGEEEESGGELVVGLLVFGGMDTSGHVHNDCFVIVPN